MNYIKLRLLEVLIVAFITYKKMLDDVATDKNTYDNVVQHCYQPFSENIKIKKPR